MSQIALALLLFSAFPATAQAVGAAAPAAASPAGVPGQPPAYIPPGAPTTPAVVDPATKELSAKFSAVVKCEEGMKDPLMHYCAWTRIGQDPMWTPAQPTSYAGLTVLVKTGADLKKALSEPASLSVLHLGPSSGKLVFLGAAANPEGKATASLLQKVLAGDQKDRAVLPETISASWKNDVHVGRARLKLDRLFADMSGQPGVRLFRADTPRGAALVTVETVADGQRFSVFPMSTGIK
ncbi:MAG TPA: hypothetical protein PKE31_10645 [Pseudomonadota bacterium]|nr:hypothetical protein [Pseudomonadota bacterium]